MTKVRITIERARTYPGILGKILPAMLEEYGEYQCIINGDKIHFILKTK